jgi:hypothetical protein
MKAVVRALALLLCAGPALAQRDREGPQRPASPSPMSQDQRQRMRDDMREVYRERGADPRGARPERPRPMSPEQREKLRRDVQNANKDLRR